MAYIAKTLADLIAQYSYYAVFAALLLENTALLGVFIPGVTILLIAGFLCAIGELNFGYCVAAGFLGTVAGDNLSYVFGRYGAERLGFVKRFLERNSGMAARIASLNTYTLVFFHFPGFLRIAAPSILGAARLHWRKWLCIDLLGGAMFN